MGNLGALVVKLLLERKEFRAGMDEAVSDVQGSAQKITQSVGAIKEAVTDAAAGGTQAIASAGRALAVLGPIAGAAVVAAGAVTLAYHEAGKEVQAFEKSLILTGNAAGTYAGQMADMARAIDQVVGTQAEASKAIAVMAGTGRVAGQDLQKFSQLAVEMERVVGTSVADTAKTFTELGKEPTKAALALNEGVNYLTRSTYEQIRAAEELGDKEQAASIAQNAYADAMSSRTKQIKDNLGTVEVAWKAVRDFALEAWDAFLGVGRKKTISDEVAEAFRQVDVFEAKLAELRGKGYVNNAPLEKNLALARELLATKLHEKGVADLTAAADAESVKRRNAQLELSQQLEASLDRQAKKQRDLNAANKLADDAGASAAERQKLLDAVEARYKEKTPKGTKAPRDTEAEKEAAILAQLIGLNADYVEQLARRNRMLLAGKLTQDEHTQSVQELFAKQPLGIRLAKEQAEADKAGAKAKAELEKARQKELSTLSSSVEKVRAETAALKEQTERLGLSQEAVEELDAAKLEAMATDQELQAMRMLERGQDQEKYNLMMAEAQAWRELAKAKREYSGKKVEVERQEDSDKAARRAGEEASRELERATDQYTQGLIDAARQGGDSLEKYITEALKRRAWEIVLQPVMSGLGGLMATVMGAGGGGGVGGAAGGGGWNNLISLGSNAYQFSQGSGMLYNAYGAASAYMGVGNAAAASYLSHPLAGIATNGTVSGLATQSAGATLGGGGTGAAAGSWGAGGIAALIALAVINAVGGMRTETMIGSGLAGKLGGKDSLTPWEEWREGGTLVSGPEFSTGNPLEVLKEQRRRLQVERDAGRGETNYAVSLQATVTSLEKSTAGLATQTEVYNREIQKGYSKYRDGVVQMADSLGLGTDAIKDWVYELGAQDLNFQGLNPEQIQAKIAETFGKAGDGMAELLIGSMKEVTETVVNTWANTTDPHNVTYETETTTTTRMEYEASVYAKAGETAIQTLERLSKSMTGFNEVSDALGFGIHDVGLAAADAADKFLEAAGGLERVANTSRSFIDAYYSDDKKREALARAGAREAERIGLKGITAQGLLDATPDQIMEGVNSLSSNPELYFDAQDWAVGIRGLWDTVETSTPVVQELKAEIDELTQAYENSVKSLKGDRDSLDVDLLRAQGDEAGAKRLERQQYLDSFVDSQGRKLDETRLQEIATLYDANAATRAHITELERLRDVSRDLAEELPAVIDKFLTPDQRSARQYGSIAQSLVDAGLSGMAVGDLAAGLAGASKEEIAAAALEIYNMEGVTDDMRLALVRAVGGLADLKDGADQLAAQELESAYQSLEKAAAKRRQELTASISEIQAVFDALKTNVRDLYGEVDSTKGMLAAQGRQFIEGALATAQGGGALPDSKKLTEAIAAVRGGFASAGYTSQFEQDRERLVLAGKLTTLQDISGEALGEAEASLKALEDLLVAERAAVDAARVQLDATYKGTAATESVATAVNNLHAVLAGLASRPGAPVAGGAAPTHAGGGGAVMNGANGAQYDGSSDIFYAGGTGLPYLGADLAKAAIDMVNAGQAEELYQLWTGAGGTAEILGQLTGTDPAALNAWAEANGLPSFEVGTNYIPEDMVAQVHQGERIIPAADNRALMSALEGGGRSGDSETAREIRMMREQAREQARAMTRILSDMARMQREWDAVGQPPVRDDTPVGVGS